MINELIIPVINYLLNVHPKLRERFFQARGLPCQAFRRAKKGRPEAGKTRPQMLPYMLETMAADAHGVFSDASRPEAGKTRPKTLINYPTCLNLCPKMRTVFFVQRQAALRLARRVR